MTALLSLIQSCNEFLWSGPLLLLLMGTHLYFTLKFFPQRNIGKAIRLSVTPDGETEDTHISVFATLATTLAATLGTGNIVGVSTAIALGGPGALFWCWITGILGMATSYAECFLSVRFRERKKDGHFAGGAMYVWKNGLGNASVGKFYAFLICLAAFGVGCTTQSNAVSRTTLASFGVPSRISGFLLAVLAGFVILGGIRSISSLCVRIVPVLAVLFTGSCLLLLWINRAVLPEALLLILNSAFTGKAVTGGLTGSSLLLTIRYGIARGLFTNEAGIGTAAIPAAASSSTSCSRQAYVSMTAVFWDTVVMCLLSGLVIITNMLAHPSSLEGVSADGLTEAAFSFLPFFGSRFLSLCLIAFAITTLIGWSYLGECAMDFLAGNKGLFLYRTLYIVMIYVGAVLPLSFVWECTDLINALMVLPNVCALFLLHKYIEA